MAAFEIETDSAANWIAIHFLEKQSGMKMGTNSIFEPSTACKSDGSTWKVQRNDAISRYTTMAPWDDHMIPGHMYACL